MDPFDDSNGLTPASHSLGGPETHFSSLLLRNNPTRDNGGGEFASRDLEAALLAHRYSCAGEPAPSPTATPHELDRAVVSPLTSISKPARDSSYHRSAMSDSVPWQSVFDLPNTLLSTFTTPVGVLPLAHYQLGRSSKDAEEKLRDSPPTDLKAGEPKRGGKRKADDFAGGGVPSKSERQRQAARRYRQRKKARMEQLQKDVDTLIEEKHALLKEREKIQEHLLTLETENISLKGKHSAKASELGRKRIELVNELGKLYREGASDAELEVVLEKLKLHCKKVEKLGQCHWKHLISPNSISQLANAGVFRKTSIEAGNPARDEGILHFIQKIVDVVHGLSPEQISAIRQRVVEYFRELQPVRDDQVVLDTQVREVIKTASPSTQSIIEKLAVLEELRRNMAHEADLYQLAAADILDVLASRQRAQFYLQVEAEHMNVMRLKEVWEALNGGDREVDKGSACGSLGCGI